MSEKQYNIYAIQHNKTKRIYVGKTEREIADRYVQHIYDLRRGKHKSKKMQEDFIKYGEDYSLYLLETVSSERICNIGIRGNYSSGSICEFKWMEKYDSINEENGYNAQDVAAKKFIDRLRAAKTTSIPLCEGLPKGAN